MLRSYFKTAYRNLLKAKAYTLTNIFGLAVGITATILILIYIRFEFSYDKFHEDSDSIYRVSIVRHREGKLQFDSPIFTPPIGPAMARDFPEVENFVRLSTWRTAYFAYQERSIKVQEIIHADSSFFDIFSFELSAGNPKTALANPFSIVLTEEIAERLFGSENPLGKTIKLDNKDNYLITGIVKNPPANSHIQFTSLISFSTLYRDPNYYMDWNGGNQYIAYVQLVDNASSEDVEAKFPEYMWRYINEEYANYGIRLEPYLQPLQDIHLHHNDYSSTLRTNIYLFSAVALLILLIACINFINLTTARASKRAKEVGVRKVLGANKQILIGQFLGESILITFVALIVGLLLVDLLFPIYQNILNKDFEISSIINFSDVWALGLIVLLVGVVAGSYPALYLSAFQAVRSLKGEYDGSGRGKWRNGLVVFQFAISISLIACTILISRQLGFLNSKDLGFSKENIIVLPLIGEEMKSKSEILKWELSNLPNVVSVAASSEVPHNGFTSNGYVPEGFKNPVMIKVVDVDESFFATFDIDIVKGRNFSAQFSGDKTAYLINESLAAMLSWQDPIGKTINRNGDHKVIGVVKDFHYATLHDKVQPLIITNQPWGGRFSKLSVKVRSNNISETLSAIEGVWQKLAPTAPFDYWFLDHALDNLYKSEQRFQEAFYCSSSLAIIIALLGLLALTAFSTEQRTKEVGIRKVLGASVVSISGLLSKDFLKLVVVANVIAWPAAYVAINSWLQNFAYRIEIGVWAFASAGILALLFAFLIVNVYVLKAALANPVESLRYE